MTWLSLALTLLKIVSSIMTWAREQSLIDEGYDKAIAETTQEILRKTAVGKQLMEQVDAMSDSQVDDALRNLEPK
jgi:hypothetical protein